THPGISVPDSPPGSPPGNGRGRRGGPDGGNSGPGGPPAGRESGGGRPAPPPLSPRGAIRHRAVPDPPGVGPSEQRGRDRIRHAGTGLLSDPSGGSPRGAGAMDPPGDDGTGGACLRP